MTADRPDLAALRALAEAATLGPWDSGPQFPDDPSKTEFYVQERSLHYLICRMQQVGEHHTGPWEWSPILHPRADAAYIAACSPERILALIAEVEEWQRQAVEASVRAERAEGNAARLADRLQRMDDEDDVLRHEADEAACHAR